MSQIAFRTATTAALTFLAAFMSPAYVSADEPRVVIRIYDVTGGPEMRAAAIRTAAAIVEDAGIAVDWRDCSTDGGSAPCQNARGARNLIVRIMTSVTATGVPRGPVETRTGCNYSDLELGFAVVDEGTRAGAMATIFHDCVQTVARRTGVEYSDLLGRAMAHELGHLLLRIAGHSRTGLMRAVWTEAELRLNRHEDWVFAPPELRELQAGSVAARALLDLARSAGRRPEAISAADGSGP